MPEFYRYKPEARFGHYLMMIGALGEGDCTAPGRRYGEYENSIGTGQVHYWSNCRTTASPGHGVRISQPLTAEQPAMHGVGFGASLRDDVAVAGS